MKEGPETDHGYAKLAWDHTLHIPVHLIAVKEETASTT